MFGISGEHLVVLVVILLIFGPKRLPALGNTLGKAIKNFKDSVSGIEDAKFRKLDDESERPEFRAADLATPTTTSVRTADAVAAATGAPKNDPVSGAGSSSNSGGSTGGQGT